MADSKDELIIKIGADFKQLRTELDKAGKTVNDFSDDGKKALTRLESSFKKFDKQADETGKGVKKLSGNFGGLVGKIGNVKVAIAAVTAVAGVYVNRAAESAIETERWAMRLGMSASELSKLSNVAQLGGANLDDLTDTMKEVNIKALEAAEGNEGYRKTFQSLGIDARTFAQLPIEQQFRAFSDAVSTADVDTQQLVRAVDDLASDAGIRMIETLKKGSKGIDEMGNSAAVTAASLSEFDFQQIKEAKVQMDRFKLSIEALANVLLVKLAPAMSFAGERVDALSAKLKSDPLNEFQAELEQSRDKLIRLREALSDAEASKNALDDSFLGDLFGTGEARISNIKEQIKLEEEKNQKITSALVKQIQLEKELKKTKALDGAPVDAGTLATTTITGDKGDEGETPDLGMWEQYLKDKQAVIDAAKEVEHSKANEWRELELGREKDNAERNAMMWKSGLEGRAQVTSKVLGDMSKMMGSKNKEMFKIGKMAAMAQVAIDTPKAAMSAYSALAGIPIVGPAMGAAAAAAAIASGMSQLSNIKSQSFQGGGGGGASAGGMTAGGGAAAATAEAPAQIMETNVTFSGGGDVSQDQFRGFVAGLNDALDDGMTLGRITA